MNGAAERLNQTVVDGARKLLHQSNIGKSFWPEAVLFFVYVWKRLCHGDQTKTPFELYTGVKPSIQEDKVIELCNVSLSRIDQNSSYSGAVLVPKIPDVTEEELVDSVEIGREVLDENLPSSSLQSTHQMVPQSQEADSSESEDDHGDKSSISSPLKSFGQEKSREGQMDREK
ncbi:uncharacterized protein TNCV_4042571 [Trichonephila clavipes]|nr:uncharacterized protein TNCV_4042571 [Trichonephila clavipes]